MIKNLMKYILIIAAVSVIVSIIIIMYYSNNNKDTIAVQDKIKQEVSYLDKNIISIINSLNNLDTEFLITKNEIFVNKANNDSNNSSGQETIKSEEGNESNKQLSVEEEKENENKSNNSITQITSIQSQSVLSRNRDDINWEYIQSVLEEISNSWTIITIDLKSIDVSNEDLLTFSNNLDIALKSAKEKDKNTSIINIANLYNLLPIYEKSCTDDTKNVELKYIKADIISSYALLNAERWTEISPLLNDAEERITKLINLNNNSSNLQEIYVKLKEYTKSVNDMDIDLCFMKYYYLINDLKKEN